MILVKSETSERYHLCSRKKAICSRNIMTLWFQALVTGNKSNFWSINTMCTHYIACELHPSLPHLFTILCSILCFLIFFLLQILFGKLETQVSKFHYKIILQPCLIKQRILFYLGAIYFFLWLESNKPKFTGFFILLLQ